MNATATAILESLRTGLHLSIGEVRFWDARLRQEFWLLDAVAPDGTQTWVSKAVCRYDAAVALAMLVGMELGD